MSGRIQNEECIATFNAQVQDALSQPVNANLEQLWQWFDRILEGLPQDEVLVLAGDAIAKLASICATRAEMLLDEWQAQQHPPSPSLVEPVLSDELLTGLLRHTMSLNLENVLEDVDPQYRRKRWHPEDSVAADVEKDAVLAMLDQIELKQAVLQTAYDEAISEWSAAVCQWIEKQPQPVGLDAILHSVKLSPVQVWLGLLLASPGYLWQHQWKTDEEFYLPASIKILGNF